ncbi:hypothetical protein IAR50_007260 [Cryptococcus sp. DSM 104548]
MIASLPPLLLSTTPRIIALAAQPGGPLEKEEFTMNIARAQIEDEMGLIRGELAKKEWKGVVKRVVQEEIDKAAGDQSEQESDPGDCVSEGEEEEEEPIAPTPSPSPPPRPKRKRNSKQESPASSPFSIPSISPQRPPTSKTHSLSGRKQEPIEILSSQPSSPSPLKARKNDVVVVDDEEDAQSEMSSVYDTASQARRAAKSKAGLTPSPSPVKKKKERASTGKRKGKDANENMERKTKKKCSEEIAASSEDETPKKKKQAAKSRVKKDPHKGLSPQEIKVAELKKLIVACGLRKQWSKELASCPSSSSQVSYLQGMLRDLGMRGTPTLGKARSIREKRELAQELDDVKAYERERGRSADKQRLEKGKKSSRKSRDTDDSDGDNSAPEKGAMEAVMDFFGDDDDSD